MPTETLGDWERRRGYEATEDEIEGLPEIDVEPVTTLVDGPLVLMDRSCGGWKVQLQLTGDGRVVIRVQPGEGQRTLSAFVPSEHALDAFEHPFCYLPR